ncbi:GntR family transcriptional regulator [Ruania alba]|uniref:DNA-binding transcriptional regulator, GntR family n=1 Tax=Ruania alba TaxID=648782 RepID=A0A1H5LPT4_9MICO|nr:GntR family transcriptional regulator [Ruania alba]SEE79000.1 DNA-binding transcriptional regulator, GntR family [Ruania alba]
MTSPGTRGQRASRRALRDEVYDALLTLLVAGELEAGQQLGIEALATRLDVSPTPIREALVHLEATGLVTRSALRGYKVAPPMTEEAIAELFDARVLLEVGALQAVTEDAWPDLAQALADHLGEQRRQAEQLRDAGDVAGLRAYLAADRAFHDAILAATGNRYLQQMSGHIGIHGERLRQFVEQRHSDADRAIAEHDAVLQAIAAGDREQAVATMTTHLAGVRERTLRDAHRSG